MRLLIHARYCGARSGRWPAVTSVYDGLVVPAESPSQNPLISQVAAQESAADMPIKPNAAPMASDQSESCARTGLL